MSEPFSLSELRAQVGLGSDLSGVRVLREVMFALLDVAEASMRVEWGPTRSWEDWDRLGESLERFTA